MSSTSRTFALVLLGMGLVACGGGGNSPAAEQPLNVDYSTLRLAELRVTPLQYADGGEGSYAGATMQVDGVDEADAVRYDGHSFYVAHPIARTDVAAGTAQLISNYVIEDEQSTAPLLSVTTEVNGQLIRSSRSENGGLQRSLVCAHGCLIHLLEVAGGNGSSPSPQLKFHGLLETGNSTTSQSPPLP